MFNVLPENFKAEIIQSYKERRIIMWLGAAIVLVITFFIGMLPSYVNLMFQEKDLEAQNSTGFTTASQTAIDLEKNITQTNLLLSAVVAHVPHQSVYSVLTRIIALKGAHISLNGINFVRKDGSSGSVILTGFADTREDLQAFEKRLEAEPSLYGVDLPVSNFAKSTHVPFSINFNEKE